MLQHPPSAGRRTRAGASLHPVALACAIGLSSLAATLPALAQVPQAAQGGAVAAMARQRQIDLPAQPLGQVLNALAREWGVPVLMDAALDSGRTAPALRGNLTLAQALGQALAGTGLAATPSGAAITVQRRGAADAALAPVLVTAERDAMTEGTGNLLQRGPSTTATGLPLTLRETPQSVTVVTRERMDAQNLQSLADVATQVPGLYFVGHGTPVGGRSQLMSRGFMVNAYQVDGFTVPWESMGEADRYSHASLDTAIYDSITVVRGATGLLTGAGDPSGSIGLTRKKPTHEFQGSAALTLGSWDRRRLVLDVGGPLNAAGSLRGRLVGAHDAGRSWVDRYSDERNMLYGVLQADLAPQTQLTLSLEHGTSRSKGTYWHEESGPPLFFSDGVTPIPAGRGDSMAPSWTYTDSQRTSLSAALEHRLNADWKASLNYGYARYAIDSRRAMVFSVPANSVPTNIRLLVTDQRNDVQWANAKLEGQYALFGRRHDLVAGVDLSYTRLKHPFSHMSRAGSGQARWSSGGMVWDTPDWSSVANDAYDTDTDQHGVYLATRLRPSDALSVILGGRLTQWKTFTAYRDPYLVSDDRRYRNEFTPYAGVVYELTPTLSAYASTTKIFKPQSVKDVNGQLLEPESGSNHEIGLKGEFLEGRLNASIAVFQTRKDNLAVEDGANTTPDGDQAYRAESNTKGRGWELEVAGELARGWQLQGGYTRFRVQDAAGAPLNTDVPIHQFKLYTSYRLAALPKLTLGGGVRWQSKTWADWVSPAEQPAYTIGHYTVVDLSARYQFTDQLDLSINLDNLFDRHYRTGTSSHSYGAPRNVEATLRYRF